MERSPDDDQQLRLVVCELASAPQEEKDETLLKGIAQRQPRILSREFMLMLVSQSRQA